MDMRIAGTGIASIKSSASGIIDLGPIRIVSCRRITQSAKAANYQLTLSTGVHEVIVETSQHGKSIRLMLDGQILGSISTLYTDDDDDE